MFRGYQGPIPKPEDVRGYFRDEISDDEVAWMISKFKHYIFVDDQDDRREGVCSACRMSIRLPYRTKHNEMVECPSCGRLLQVKHIWRGTSVCWQEKLFYIYEKSIKDPNAIGCRVVCAFMQPRGKTSAYGCACIELYEDSMTLFLYGYGGLQIEKIYWKGEGWEEAASLTERKALLHVAKKDCWLNKESVREAIKGTPFAWSNWEAFDADSAGYGFSPYIKLFDLFAKREAMEYLLKTGFRHIIWAYGIYETARTYHAINWHGKTPNEIFKIATTKEDRQYLWKNARWMWCPTSHYVVKKFLQNRERRVNLRSMLALRNLFRDEYATAAGVPFSCYAGYANRAERTYQYVAQLDLTTLYGVLWYGKYEYGR